MYAFEVESTFLTVYICVIAFILGSVMGSFINCLASRYITGESILKGRSHCGECGHVLGLLDLVPVFSYLVLGGKCRYCHAVLSPRYMVTEIALGVAYIGITLVYGLSPETLIYMALAAILLALSLVDMDTYEIPDRFILSGIVLWAIEVPFLMMEGCTLWEAVKPGLRGGVAIGGGMLLLSLIFDKVTGKESLGGGDVKLFFVVGLYLGLAGSLLNLIIACIIGIVFALGMKEKRIPFGPAISLATYFSLLFGQEIVVWYVGLL